MLEASSAVAVQTPRRRRSCGKAMVAEADISTGEAGGVRSAPRDETRIPHAVGAPSRVMKLSSVIGLGSQSLKSGWQNLVQSRAHASVVCFRQSAGPVGSRLAWSRVLGAAGLAPRIHDGGRICDLVAHRLFRQAPAGRLRGEHRYV